MKPILVHTHIFYPDLWGELKECIKNIGDYKFDLFVTLVDNHQQTIEDIKQNFPKAHIEIVENRGYDTAPFVHILNKINLDDYSYLIKLHTKRNLTEGAIINYFNVSGSLWRSYALSFLKSKADFEKYITALEQDKNLGMVSNYHLIIRKEIDDLSAQKHAMDLLKKHGLPNKGCAYVAGTIFLCRASLLEPLQKSSLKLSDFELPDIYHRKSTLAHTMERFLGALVLAQGQKISDPVTRPQYSGSFYALIRRISLFIYRRRINSKGKLSVKFCKIPLPTFLFSPKTKHRD